MVAPILWGCGFYKFNVSSVDPAVKNVSVAFIENKASIVNPQLSTLLSDKLRNKFISESSLSLVEREGDFAFSGEITRYEVVPVASQGNATATLNRLTIGVNIKLDCTVAPKHAFNTTFSQFEDFDASKSLTDVEGDLIESICENLVNEIFNKATLDW
jgi:hypothetical protein